MYTPYAHLAAVSNAGRCKVVAVHVGRYGHQTQRVNVKCLFLSSCSLYIHL